MSYLQFYQQQSQDYLSVSCVRVLDTYEEIDISYIRGIPACFEQTVATQAKEHGWHSYAIYHEFLAEKEYSKIHEYKIRKQMSDFADITFDYEVPLGRIYAGIKMNTEYTEGDVNLVLFIPAQTENCADVLRKIVIEDQYDFANQSFSDTLSRIVKAIPHSVLTHAYVDANSWCFLHLYGEQVHDIFQNSFRENFDSNSAPVWKRW